MTTDEVRKFAPGFLLEVDGVLSSREKGAATPEEALARLLQSKRGYLVTPGTKVRVYRIVDAGDEATTELYGERVELPSLISTEKVLRRIYTSTLEVSVDFVFDLAPSETPPGYEDLLREMEALCERVRSIQLRRVAMMDGVHECDEDCPHFYRGEGHGNAPE